MPILRKTINNFANFDKRRISVTLRRIDFVSMDRSTEMGFATAAPCLFPWSPRAKLPRTGICAVAPLLCISLGLREQSVKGRAWKALFAFMDISLREQALDVDAHKRKNAALSCSVPYALHCAERQGFEPRDPFRSTVFKTAAIDHSAISPSLMGLQI